MSPNKVAPSIVTTPAREHLREEIGDAQLKAIESTIGQQVLTDVIIVETEARARLREVIGEAKLY